MTGSSDGSIIGDTDGAGLYTTPDEPDRPSKENQQEVSLTGDFYMSKYLVTVMNQAMVLNAGGIPEADCVVYEVSSFGVKGLFKVDPYGNTIQWNNHTNQWESTTMNPMIHITCYGAKAYADWIVGTLPKEVQWEYACRAGTKTAYSYGDTADDDYTWYRNNNSGFLQPVGQKTSESVGSVR